MPPAEVITVELGRAHGGHSNVIALESTTKADFYPLSSSEAEWFSRRRTLEIGGRKLWFAIPEAVILHKLRFYREGGSENTCAPSAACSAYPATKSTFRY